MRLAWAFGAESLATHPFRTEHGKSGPPFILVGRRKAGPARRFESDGAYTSDQNGAVLHLEIGYTPL